MTPEERRMVDTIKSLTVRDVAPTLQEVADAMGLRSKGTVHRKVHNLVAEGILRMEKGARGVRLAEPPAHIVTAIAKACADANVSSLGRSLPESVLENVVRIAWTDAL